MKQTQTTRWLGNMAFEAEVSGHKLILDADEAVGGTNKGPRPKALMMTALAGCTGMDVVSLLKKMRIDVDDFQIHIHSETTEEHPKQYSSMHIVYEFTGANLEEEKLRKIIELSQDKYCGVSASYKKAFSVSYEIKINNKA